MSNEKAKELHKNEIIETRNSGIKTNYIKIAENSGLIQSNSFTQNSEKYYEDKFAN